MTKIRHKDKPLTSADMGALSDIGDALRQMQQPRLDWNARQLPPLTDSPDHPHADYLKEEIIYRTWGPALRLIEQERETKGQTPLIPHHVSLEESVQRKDRVIRQIHDEFDGTPPPSYLAAQINEIDRLAIGDNGQRLIKMANVPPPQGVFPSKAQRALEEVRSILTMVDTVRPHDVYVSFADPGTWEQPETILKTRGIPPLPTDPAETTQLNYFGEHAVGDTDKLGRTVSSLAADYEGNVEAEYTLHSKQFGKKILGNIEELLNQDGKTTKQHQTGKQKYLTRLLGQTSK